MDPAEEKQRMESVRKAVKLLRTGAVKTRTDLFPTNSPSRNIQRQIIHELLAKGAIRKVRESLGRVGTTYQVKDIDVVQELLDDDVKLSDVAFSSRASPPKLEEVMVKPPTSVLTHTPKPQSSSPPTQSFFQLKETPPSAPAPPPQEAQPPPAPPEPPVAEAPPSPAMAPAPVQALTQAPLDPASVARTNELLTELVEVMHNALQSFVYVRDQVKELNVRVKAMERTLERIDDLFKPSGDSNESRASSAG